MDLLNLSARLRDLTAQSFQSDIKLARGMAHLKFDQIWKRKLMTRRQAYVWLQGAMNMTEEQAHMEHMDAVQCQMVIDRVKEAFPCLR